MLARPWLPGVGLFHAHFSGTFKRFTGVTPGQFRHAARA